jgi:hypothetical protein
VVVGLRLPMPMPPPSQIQLGIVRHVKPGRRVKPGHPVRRVQMGNHVRMASRVKRAIGNRVSVVHGLRVGAQVAKAARREKADVLPVKVAKVVLRTARAAMFAGTTTVAASGRTSWPTSIWTS